MFTLPKLPYAYNALEPFINETTMKIHHGNHHQIYVDKLNATLQGHDDLLKQPAQELVKNWSTLPDAVKAGVRNFGGGVINHTFFWEVMKKDVALPNNKFMQALTAQFQTVDQFKQQFSDSAAKLFGSGWTWLVLNQDKLEIVNTPNQDTPLSEGKTPLLVIDVWEHAYYLQYQYKRADFIKAWWNVVNWQQVSQNFDHAKK